MGYILRVLRIASYLSAALGLILTFGGTNNEALLLYGVRFLVIGLVGIGATSFLRDRYLEDTEEEEYNSLLPTPQIKTPNIPLVPTTALSLTNKDVLQGGIAGFIGVLVSSCGATIALDWNSVDGGAGYIFWILTCLGHPLVGAFLGGVSGIYASFFLTRYYDADLFREVDIIIRIFVGFIVGLLVGIAPYILLGAWG